VPEFGFVLDIIMLTRNQWERLRDIRLTALLESPDSFLATYELERDYGKDQWQAEFGRGDWHIGMISGREVSLLGTTRLPDTPAHQCYLEYLWVSPRYRRAHVASWMLTAVLNRLHAAGLRTAFLWVLEGNEVATQLYKRFGFVSTNHRQPLPGQADRSEERMQLDLSDGPPRSATGT
jgi:ribosomal protein S18 acetylase RimI-like enzyme